MIGNNGLLYLECNQTSEAGSAAGGEWWAASR
jgi:hypothetical protein